MLRSGGQADDATQQPMADGLEEDAQAADNATVASAFNGSGSIKCDYNQTGGLVGTAYVKGGKVRIDGMVNGASANVIYTSGKVYSWGQASGLSYGVVIDAPTAGAAASSVPTTAEMQKQFTSGTTSCVNFTADDSLFVPPTSIQFKNISDLQKMMPAGAGPSGY